MSLDIKKLHNILYSKGLLPTSHFVYNKQYYIIEATSVKNNESCFIYIPEKYGFKVDKSSKDLFENFTHYKIKKIDFDINNSNISERYTDNTLDEGKYYPELDIDDSKIKNDGDVEQNLIENYEKPILLKDEKNMGNAYELKDTYRQLSRLKNCVKYILYKLSIISGNYLCLTNNKEEIECFYIKHYENKPGNKKLFVVVSLEKLISSSNDFVEDIKDIFKGIRTLLDKNQQIHKTKLTKLIEKKDYFINGLAKMDGFKKRIDNMLGEYEHLLDEITVRENKINEKITSMRQTIGSTASSFNKDTHNAFEINKLETELGDIQTKRDSIRGKMIELQDYCSNVILKVDQILFDNIVLLKTIHSNIDNFEKIFSSS